MAAEATCERLDGVLPTDGEKRVHLPKTSKPYVLEGAEGHRSFSLIVPDQKTGTFLTVGSHSEQNQPHRTPWYSTPHPIPSGRRIVSVVKQTDSYWVSDDRGNVFRLHPTDDNGPPLKRTREESGSIENPFLGYEWTAVVDRRGSEVVPGAEENTFAALLSESAFGMEGWSGVCLLPGGPASVVNSRQYYMDVRLIDAEQKKVVRTYSTSHPPTGILSFESSTANELEHCVLVAEGVLASVYDMRCSSAVLQLSEVKAVTEDETLRARIGSQQGLAVPGRLTSAAGRVRDVCPLPGGRGGWEGHEVALAIDRALCVYDVRKFTKQFTQSNVLKYSIASITGTSSGTAVVCAGIDSEVRVVPVQRTKEKTAVVKSVDPNTPAVSTFRTRIDSSIACAHAWCGGWVSNDAGTTAIGISVDNEFFIAN